ncbi:isoprenoid synthase domain-containing protein [Stachybotrys elegans]|uniref:Terpene synthase n=1 Tax=Stachybotrys elegans TaxID=80388 RepID=A0A8K0WMS2_9HYPO|nr:isoprenoid synthase domain-containing protein [Stachybotrys elegans]
MDTSPLLQTTRMELENTRDSILAKLRGASIILPDLQDMMKHFPAGVHQDAEKLHQDVQMSLEDLIPSHDGTNRLSSMIAANHAFLGAFWWPGAPYDSMRIATWFLTWLFYWDDEIDSTEFSTLISDIELSTNYREETLRFIEASLGGMGDMELSRISSNPLITSFAPIGKGMWENASERHRNDFLREIQNYFEMTMEEQISQLEERLPSPSEYMARRMYSGGVLPTLALHEYAIGIELPDDVAESKVMQEIWHETNVIICLTNDILSLKKEVDLGQVDSLIALLLPESSSVQHAVDKAADIVRTAVSRLDAAEKTMLDQYPKGSQLYQDVKLFIDSCKTGCTGNLNWSLASTRYKLGSKSMKGGLWVTL